MKHSKFLYLYDNIDKVLNTLALANKNNRESLFQFIQFIYKAKHQFVVRLCKCF